jgi:hypothetical protein
MYDDNIVEIIMTIGLERNLVFAMKVVLPFCAIARRITCRNIESVFISRFVRYDRQIKELSVIS